MLSSPGLCADCASSRQVRTDRSTFFLCERALTDPSFTKYPLLPVWSCPGYQRAPGPPAEPGSGDKLTR